MNEIVSVAWLNQNKENKNLLILDASMNKITEKKSKVLSEETIPNSLFFDLKNSFSDKESEFPNTIPSSLQFETECRKLGINNSTQLVVFDNLGVYSTPRVWWLFRAMGHKNIAVLDGGLPEWKKQKLETEIRKPKEMKQGDFKANFNPNFVFDYEQVAENCSNNKFTIVDARSAGRFAGTENEPRKRLQSGHIPHSINIPFGEVLTEGKFKSKPELIELFDLRSDSEKELVFSCGSGLTASIVMLAHVIAKGNNYKIYDGSWTEWAEKQKLFS